MKWKYLLKRPHYPHDSYLRPTANPENITKTLRYYLITAIASLKNLNSLTRIDQRIGKRSKTDFPDELTIVT